MASRWLIISLLLLNSIHATLVLAQTEYASPATPTVPVISASSPWLTTTKPSATFGAINPPHSSTSESSEPKLSSDFNNAKIAHALLGAVAFLLVFPLGGIIIKVWPHRYIVWIHAAIQAFGLALYSVCFGLGIWMGGQLRTLHRYHAILGYVNLAFIVIQPLLKLHWFHSAVPRVAFFMHIHLWLGRLALMLGIIDGGLGFRISSTLQGPYWPSSWKIIYGVIGGIVWVVYVGICIVWVELKKVPRAAPPSPGALPGDIVMLAEQDVRNKLEDMRPKTGDTVVSASAVDSDVESGRTVVATPRKASRAEGWAKL